MNKFISNTALFALLSFTLIIGCTAPSVPQTVKTVEDNSHEDDAAKYRPQVQRTERLDTAKTQVISNEAIQGAYNIDTELEAIVDSMFIRNDSIRQYDGFTILVYSGNDQIEAGKVRNRLFDLVPEQEAKFSYKLPTYFVKIGVYLQQLEAAPMLKMIQETYPSAAIVPEKFPIIKDESEEN